VEQSFETYAKNLDIPVVGLYPNRTNEVVVTLKFEGGEVTDTVMITTDKLPDYIPRIEINKLDRSKMEAGMHLCDIHYAKNGTYDSRPMIFDDNGEVRWYMDFSFFNNILWPIQRIKNGNLLVGGRNEIFEYDMPGNNQIPEPNSSDFHCRKEIYSYLAYIQKKNLQFSSQVFFMLLYYYYFTSIEIL